MALSAPRASGGGGAGLPPAGADGGQGRSVSGERLDAEVAALRVRIVPRPRDAGRAPGSGRTRERPPPVGARARDQPSRTVPGGAVRVPAVPRASHFGSSATSRAGYAPG